jgi:hypothetical protein
MTEIASSTASEELNLCGRLAATLVDRKVLYKNKEVLNGVDAYEERQKQKATAEGRLHSQDKRFSAGLLASADRFNLGTEVWDHVQQRADAAKEKEYNAYLRRKDKHDIILAKVQESCNQKLPLDK